MRRSTRRNHLVISSGEALTVSRRRCDGDSATATAALAGSLNTQNVLSVAGANSTIQSIDAALTSVSTLRSTLGAIQNRFQSTINSLQGCVREPVRFAQPHSRHGLRG